MEIAVQQDSDVLKRREAARRELLKWIIKNEALRRGQSKAVEK